MRVCMYLPDLIVKLLLEEYPEAHGNPSRALRLFILEVLGRAEQRRLRHASELRALAYAELVKEKMTGTVEETIHDSMDGDNQ